MISQTARKSQRFQKCVCVPSKNLSSKLVIISSNLTTETLEQGVKYVQSWQ